MFVLSGNINFASSAESVEDSIKMKALLFMIIVGIFIGTVASNPMVSMDQAMEQAVFTHELYLNATCRKLLNQVLIK